MEVDTNSVQHLVYFLHKEHMFKYVYIDTWTYVEQVNWNNTEVTSLSFVSPYPQSIWCCYTADILTQHAHTICGQGALWMRHFCEDLAGPCRGKKKSQNNQEKGQMFVSL